MVDADFIGLGADLDVLADTLDTTPLVVNIDSALVRTNIFLEFVFARLGRFPWLFGELLSAFGRGMPALKHYVVTSIVTDVSYLPLDPDVLAVIDQVCRSGRSVHLVSANDERYVRAVADHIGLVEYRSESNDRASLSTSGKTRHLVDKFGEGGFDYVGGSENDIPVWVVARHRVAVRASTKVCSTLLALDPDAVILGSPIDRMRSWVEVLRVHQWAKNGLVFLPLLTAHRFDFVSVRGGFWAFMAFCFAASGIYILNDLVDLDADRRHPTKKHRPLAAGAVSVQKIIFLAPVLVALALVVAWQIGPGFFAALIGYISMTTAYTFFLKRKMLVDVFALASLYSLRVIGGAAAVSIPVSEWLIAFSMFMFTSLALIKRYVELAARLDADLPDLSNRNYRKSDLDIVAALAAAAGFNAVTVFALYISSETVHQLYSRPLVLWLVCPVLMYWLSRALMMAHRRLMSEDPIVFALTDWNSLVALALIVLILVSAI
jgi:4-hydroxybenzoate polyprenyltransferase/phosphoserine phosphatase